MKNKAFTLAEVLITLVIIGVIASLTIPTLKKVSDEKAYVSGLLKAYSELSSATKTIRRTEGPVAIWTNLGSDTAATEIIKKYKTVMPSVGVPSREYNIYTLNNETSSVDTSTFTDDSRTITAADGVIYNLTSVNNCTAEGASKNCFRFIVDVNGANEPNMIGVDIYAFDVMKNGDVNPVEGKCPPDESSADEDKDKDKNNNGSTSASDDDQEENHDNSDGFGCTARVIQEKDISW